MHIKICIINNKKKNMVTSYIRTITRLAVRRQSKALPAAAVIWTHSVYTSLLASAVVDVAFIHICQTITYVQIMEVDSITLSSQLMIVKLVAKYKTSSPAVAQRPRDASCLSVVERKFRFRFTAAYTIKFCSVLFSSSWSSTLVVTNKIHWCVALCAVNCTVHRRRCRSRCSSHLLIASCSSWIAICAYPICIRRPR